MSFDESFLSELQRALDEARLEAVVVGATAAIAQGAPLMTQDIDILIRDTPRNRAKLKRVCERLGAAAAPISEFVSALRLSGAKVPVDVLFDRIPGGLRFESLRSRAVQIQVGNVSVAFACLEDVVRSKEAADRPKDRLHLLHLRDTLRVKKALEKLERK